jgi:hypothetical protein
MQTIVELPEFERSAKTLLSDSEKQQIISYLAAHPQSGAIMQGTGGIRKLRWASGSKGKNGGVRIIYYYNNELIPLFLLTIFGKSEKANLSQAERNEFAKFTNIVAKSYGEKSV